MNWTRTTGLVATASLIAGGGIWAGCGSGSSGDDSGTDGSGGMDVMNQQDTGTNDTGTGNDTGSDGGMIVVDASALNCAYYCSTITALCTLNDNQYKDNATCMSMCGNIPDEAGAGAMSGNSLACRMPALAGLTSTNSAVNCSYAGPYGFGNNGNTASGCGTTCIDFCDH